MYRRNQRKRAQAWYLGLFALCALFVFAQAPCHLAVQRYVARTYLAYLHALYLVGVFFLFGALLQGKGRANGGPALSGFCLLASVGIGAAAYFGALGLYQSSNSLLLSAALAGSCFVDLLCSLRNGNN